jgi:eukaryotic-like serine/threonine-protein kinase
MSSDDGTTMPREADDFSFAPAPGTVLAEKYRVERVLGAGGMGYVIRAWHLELHERVAIKMLLPKSADDPETVTRFLREGRAAVKIKSEHVCRVLDVGRAGPVPFIVMEYLDGVDLQYLLEQEKRFVPDVAVEYVLQATEAIAEAHAQGIVHRDLKPANLFLVHKADGTPIVKVLDFGISKMAGPGMEHLSVTKSSSTLGSPLYMSPEQLRSSREVDARADIWALGVILFELLSGRPPFQAGSLPELGALVLTQDAPDVRKFAPDTPDALAQAIATCLRRDPGERFASVAELAAAIAPFGPGHAQDAGARIARVAEGAARRSSGRPGSTSSVALAETVRAITRNLWGTSAAGGAVQPSRRRYGVWLGAGALVALAGVGWLGSTLVASRPPRGGASVPALVGSSPIPPPGAPPAGPDPDVSAAIVVEPPPGATEAGAPVTSATAARPLRPRPAPSPPQPRPSAAPTPAPVPEPPPQPPPASPPPSGFTKDRHD